MTTATHEIIEVKPINTNSAKEFELKATIYVHKSKELVINDQSSYEQAANDLRIIKDIAKTLEDARKKITTPLDIAKKAVMDLFRDPATALDDAEAVIKRKMITYSNERERIRREQEEKLRRQAAAEEERKRKALEARAATAEANGKAEKAEDLRQQAQEVHVEAPTLASTVQKPAGISMKKNWKARVIAPFSVPREYMMIDEKKLDKVAKATQGSLIVPGVEFYAEDVLASR